MIEDAPTIGASFLFSTMKFIKALWERKTCLEQVINLCEFV